MKDVENPEFEAQIINMTFYVSDSAAVRITELCQQHGAAMVRLSVEGGGCSGFQYVYGFADSPNADDHVFTHAGASLVVDDVSLPLIAGATLEYINNLSGAHFKVNNPNASGGCGCGVSFSL